MPTTRPVTFVLVPGAFCLPSTYEYITSLLRSHNHAVVPISLPTVGKKPDPPAGLYDDAAHVRNTVVPLLNAGNDVVLVGNSYGGIVITGAAKCLSISKRARDGESGGRLIHLVYLSSVLPPENANTAELVAGKQPIPTDVDTDWMEPLPAEVGGSVLCAQMSKEEQLKFGAMPEPFSVRAQKDRVTYLGWKHVPTTFVVAGEDKTLDAKWQHENVDAVIAERWSNVRKVVLPSDHFSMVSHPKEVVEVLLKAAGLS